MPTGAVTVSMGTHSHGQGHEITFAQIAADMLGIEPPDVRVRYGDTDMVEFGTGTFGSRSIITGSNSLRISADRLIERGKKIAAVHFEAEARTSCSRPGNSRLPVRTAASASGGGEAVLYAARSEPRRCVRLLGEDHRRAEGRDLPERLPCLRSGDRSRYRHLHADRLCGGRRCRAGHQSDAGQGPGPWRRGAGGRARSCSRIFVYDEDGQLLSGSFMDYAMPRACAFPRLICKANEVLTPMNPLGCKRGRRSRTVGALAAVVNAIVDALSPLRRSITSRCRRRRSGYGARSGTRGRALRCARRAHAAVFGAALLLAPVRPIRVR